MQKISSWLIPLATATLGASGLYAYQQRVDWLAWFGARDEANAPKDACGLPIDLRDADFIVVASGAYRGTALHVDGQSRQGFSVLVPEPQRPVAILLSAYEAANWLIELPEHNRHLIKAIVATGYGPQHVRVQDASIPVATASYENEDACYSGYFRAEELSKADAVSKRFFGRPVTMFYPPVGEGAVVFKGLAHVPDRPAPRSTAQPSTVNPKATTRAPKLPASEAGLEQALRLGLIRPATEQDLLDFDARERELHGTQLPPVMQGLGEATDRPMQRTRFGQAYVILAPFEIPAGLYGGHSVNFLLPATVPYPWGDLGHSSLYNFADGTCRGVCYKGD